MKISFIYLLYIFCLCIISSACSSHKTIDSDVLQLPVKAIPVFNNPTDSTMAIILSGDGGWRSTVDDLAKALVEKNIPVVGLNCREYFWKSKTPEQTTKDVYAIIEYFNTKWHINKILWIGYSFGADVTPFIINRLPDSIQNNIQQIILLSPFITTDFEVHIRDLFNIGVPTYDYNVVNEAKQIQDIPITCIFGDAEKPERMNAFSNAGFRTVTIKSDHHFDDNIDAILNLTLPQ